MSGVHSTGHSPIFESDRGLPHPSRVIRGRVGSGHEHDTRPSPLGTTDQTSGASILQKDATYLDEEERAGPAISIFPQPHVTHVLDFHSRYIRSLPQPKGVPPVSRGGNVSCSFSIPYA